MNTLLHTLLVVFANIICWGSLVAGVVGFIAVLWASITGKGNNSGNTPGLPWL